MKFTQEHIAHLNAQFRGIPTQEIIAWAIDYAKRPVVTTNFGPYSGSLLNAVTEIKNDIPVILIILEPFDPWKATKLNSNRELPTWFY